MAATIAKPRLDERGGNSLYEKKVVMVVCEYIKWNETGKE